MILLMEILEALILGMAVLLALTQVFVPLIRNQPLFPIFRAPDRAAQMLADAKRRREAAEKLLEAAKLEAEAARLQEDALQVRVRQFEGPDEAVPPEAKKDRTN